MKRLNASDAMLLYTDTHLDECAHSMRVSVIDISRCPPEVAAQHVRDGLASTMSRLAPFSWRAMPTPLGLHHPVWVSDPDFDMDNHFYRVGCPSPGTDRELGDVVAMIASRPLDMRRPLWETWIVEGLASGHIAVVGKVHHAIADGVGTAQMFDEILSKIPVPHQDLPSLPPLKGPPIPSRAALLRLAAKDVVEVLASGPSVLSRAREVRRARRSRDPDQLPAQGHRARATSLNRQLGPHRRFATLSLPMADIKTIKNAFGVSINDVYLAACAGAMQRFLLARGELPDIPLVAGMGASIRTPEEVDTYGNLVRLMTVRLPTTVEDPVQRLLAAKAESDIAKAEFRLSAGAWREDIMGLFPPALFKLTLRGMQRLMGRGRTVLGNVALSNVPGPRARLYLGDMPIDSIYGIGPLMLGIALNITAWSYVDQFNISVLCDASAIPDPWPMTELLRDAFDELLKEATRRGTDG